VAGLWLYKKGRIVFNKKLGDGALLFCAKIQKILSRACFQEENLYKAIRN